MTSIRGKGILLLFTNRITAREPQGALATTRCLPRLRIHTTILSTLSKYNYSTRHQQRTFTTPAFSDKQRLVDGRSGKATKKQKETRKEHSLNCVKWTLEEDQSLYRFTQDGRTCTDVYQHYPERTLSAISTRMSRIRNGKSIPVGPDGLITQPLGAVHREKDNSEGRAAKRKKQLLIAQYNNHDGSDEYRVQLKEIQDREEQEELETFRRKAVRPRVRKVRPWTPEENKLLTQLMKKYRHDPGIWGMVAGRTLENKNGECTSLVRTTQSCRRQWRKLNRDSGTGKGSWNEDERSRLMDAIHDQVGDGFEIWIDIMHDPTSSTVTKEIPLDQESATTATTAATTTTTIATGVISTPEAKGKESKPLLKLRGPELGSLDWVEIARRVGTRDNTQCRTHVYTLHNGKRGPWNEEEVHRMKEAYKEFGNQWRVIAAHVGTRSPEQTRLAYKRHVLRKK